MKNTKRTIAAMLAIVMTFGLCACGTSGDKEEDPLQSQSKKELIEYAHQLEKDSEASYNRITELEEMLKGIQGEDVKPSGITSFSDGTGRETLNSVDSIVKLPVPFEYPGSVQYFNDSTLNVSAHVSIKPSSNWVAILNGTQVEIEHTSSHISGVIKVSGIDKQSTTRMMADDLKEYMNSFFSEMPPEQISYSRLYVESDYMGMDAKSHTFIDEQDAMIRCGLVGFGDICVSYFFAYKGEDDPSKDELILNLLQTMQLYNKSLRVE